jgi:hypothetical protein
MADLTLTQLAAQMPADSLTIIGGAATLDLNALMDESALAGTDEKTGEFIVKLLRAAAAAQAAYNAANPNAQLNGYPSGNFGIPTEEGGEIFATVTHTVTAQVPLLLDEITGNPL